MNNFYLYRFEGKTISQLLPWDKDSSFWAVDYDIWTNMDANALTRRALREPPLQRTYVEALRRCAELALRTPEPGPGIARRRFTEDAAAGLARAEVSFVYSQIREIAARGRGEAVLDRAVRGRDREGPGILTRPTALRACTRPSSDDSGFSSSGHLREAGGVPWHSAVPKS
jgi:hypothetical protein